MLMARNSSLDIAEPTWTNKSVLALAREADPVEIVLAKARELTFSALELGWSGPPYDPFRLAELLNIRVIANEDVPDARTTPSAGRLRIEFNPNRPAARINYSIAHEIGHSFFPDCAEMIRNRSKHAGSKDEWQLEMLCNLAAAEILMPIGTLREVDLEPKIDRVLDLRKEYNVSIEAML